jgi:hypothetical protein
MKNKVIKFSDFMKSLNEGLIKTYDIDFTILTAKKELSLLNVPYSIEKKNNNTILLKLQNFNNIYIDEVFNFLNQTFTNLLGWMPSFTYLTNTVGMEIDMIYDEDYLKANYKYLKNVTILYESKFDEVVDIPKKLYHLSIQEYESKILKYGLVPKTKSKVSQHGHRIYVCSNLENCIELISKMKLYYYDKRNLNSKWIIFEIDTNGLNLKLYKDPNFVNKGYYLTGNVSPNKIKVIRKYE